MIKYGLHYVYEVKREREYRMPNSELFWCSRPLLPGCRSLIAGFFFLGNQGGIL